MKQITNFSLILLCFSISYSQYNISYSNGVTRINKVSSNGTVQVIPISGNEAIQKVNQPQNDVPPFNWVMQFTTVGKVFKDVSFANTQVGYIVSELGWVYKTTNGGTNWTSVMGLGFPYYWYGVHALSVDTVVISGFNNQDSINHGAMRWTTNGGTTWSSDIVLSRPRPFVGWLDRVHFFDQNTGIVFNGQSGACYTTTTGGKTAGAWSFVQVDPAEGWFAGNYTTLPNGICYAAGISLSKSSNHGVTWTVGPPADGTFDGGVDFLASNLQYGWTGGGSISPTVQGWTHETTDGGTTWSPRQFLFPQPVRGVKFYNTTTGFAIGGNVYSEAGFIYSTSNGGTNWNLEVSTAAEMMSLDYKVVSPDSMDVWVVGSTGGSTGFYGKVYKARMQNLVGLNPISNEVPAAFNLFQNYPNPFNPETNINFSIPPSKGVRGMTSVNLIVYDITGKQVATIVNESLQPGTYSIKWNAANYSSGVYFYKLIAGDFAEVKKMVVVK